MNSRKYCEQKRFISTGGVFVFWILINLFINYFSWSDNPQQAASTELWASPINKISRGPPPGLGCNKTDVSIPNVASVTNPSAVSGNSNGWIVGGRGHNTNATWSGTNSSWNSNWLLLKNLSSQVYI